MIEFIIYMVIWIALAMTFSYTYPGYIWENKGNMWAWLGISFFVGVLIAQASF